MVGVFVIAILPPGNIVKLIEEVKTKLFVGFGCASVYALPPLVTLFVSEERPPAPGLSEIHRQPGRIILDQLEIRGTHIVLALEDPATCESIASQLSIEPTPHPLLPALNDAIYMGEAEGATDLELKKLVRQTGTAEAIAGVGWKRSEIVCIEFLASNEATWWNGSSLTYRWRRQLRLPARGHELPDFDLGPSLDRARRRPIE